MIVAHVWLLLPFFFFFLGNIYQNVFNSTSMPTGCQSLEMPVIFVLNLLCNQFKHKYVNFRAKIQRKQPQGPNLALPYGQDMLCMSK